MGRRTFVSVGIATGLALVLVACGIKGAPKPPVAPPAPATETQAPPQDPHSGALEPSGPTLSPTADAGVVLPGNDKP